jgi:hypothetical protein
VPSASAVIEMGVSPLQGAGAAETVVTVGTAAVAFSMMDTLPSGGLVT